MICNKAALSWIVVGATTALFVASMFVVAPEYVQEYRRVQAGATADVTPFEWVMFAFTMSSPPMITYLVKALLKSKGVPEAGLEKNAARIAITWTLTGIVLSALRLFGLA